MINSALFLVVLLLFNQSSYGDTPDQLQQQAENIYQADQALRQNIQQVLLQQPRNQQLLAELIVQQQKLDNRNRVWAIKVLDEYGWPSEPEFTDDKVANTLFLVIQHGGLALQQRYYPLLQHAVANAELEAAELAYLTDRMLVSQGKTQRYGTQINIEGNQPARLYPIEEPESVDKRRAQVGLSPLQEYVATFGIIWPTAADFVDE